MLRGSTLLHVLGPSVVFVAYMFNISYADERSRTILPFLEKSFQLASVILLEAVTTVAD